MNRHLLVDGYNVLHAWGWMKAPDAAALEGARGRLAAAVRSIRDVEAVRVTVVFDGRGDRAEADPAWTDEQFEVVFAPTGSTADSVIERMVGTASEPAHCVVATADLLERQTVCAVGGSCLTPAELEAWIERCRLRGARRMKPDDAGPGFGNRLPL